MGDGRFTAMSWIDGVVLRQGEELCFDAVNQLVHVACGQVCPPNGLPKEGIPC